MTIKGRLAIGLVVVIATFGVAPASADANPFEKFLKVLKTHTKSILKPIDCCGGISCRRLRELEAITGDPKGAMEAIIGDPMSGASAGGIMPSTVDEGARIINPALHLYTMPVVPPPLHLYTMPVVPPPLSFRDPFGHDE